MKHRIIHLIQQVWASLLARRTLWLVLGAIGFGAVAVLGARNYIGERLALEKARLSPRQEMVEVVVARRELKRGDAVSAETMAVRQMPREFVPGGVVTPARFDTVAGMAVQVPMQAGEPLLASLVASAQAGSISSRVRPGVRAMTIAVDEVNSLSGMLQPGDRIDLMVTVRPPPLAGQLQSEITRTVMQDVPVIATGRQSRASQPDEMPTGRPYTSITVEVDPDRAQRLVVAQRSGKLTAVLRNPNDRQAVAEKRLDVNELLGIAAPMPVAAPAPPPAPPQVIVGGRGPVAAPAPITPASSAPVSPNTPFPAATPVPESNQLPGRADTPPAQAPAPDPASNASTGPNATPPQDTNGRPSVPGWPAGWPSLEPPTTVPLFR